MARASVWDEQRGGRIVPAPTLPEIDIPDIDTEREAREAAERVAERRVIRNGRDWQAIGKVETLEAWRKIGAALHIGKLRAIRITRSNTGWGRAYSCEFGRWCRECGFTMRPAVRSWAIALHEHWGSINRWLEGLSAPERKKLKNPQSVVRRWQREACVNGKPYRDDAAMALAAWRCFVARVKALPSEQAAPVWQAVLAEAAVYA